MAKTEGIERKILSLVTHRVLEEFAAAQTDIKRFPA